MFFFRRKKNFTSGIKTVSPALHEFSNALRSCYGVEELVGAVHRLEQNESYAAVFSSVEEGGIVYADWERCKPAVIKKLENRFKTEKDGFFYFDAQQNYASAQSDGGFVLKSASKTLFVFCPLQCAVPSLFLKELSLLFTDFVKRYAVIDSLSYTGLLAREWSEIEKTQRSFLPQQLPNTPELELAVYFLPLTSVSGDYYSALPIDAYRTLILLGDVSGKGLSAALVMGVVLNAIQNYPKKDDLPGIIRQADKAIKLMRLPEKFSVLFAGIADTRAMELRYINASIADSYIISRKQEEITVTELPSNCSLLGIINLPDVAVQTVPFLPYDTIILASDGLSEIGHSSGVCFGDTPLYKKTLAEGAVKPLNSFITYFAEAALEYGCGGELRDDITILAARVRSK